MSAAANVIAAFGAEKPTPAEIYEIIKDFQIPASVEYYARVYGLDEATAQAHYQEFLKFMAITAANPGDGTPSDQLDEMWHAAIIQTKKYAELCEKLGLFIHHATESEPQHDRFRRTLSVYWANFGEVHPVWKDPKLKRIDGVESADKAVLADADCEDCQIVGWCSNCSSS